MTTPRSRLRDPMRTGRNEPCPCGSGRKHKSCCYGKSGASKAPALIIGAIALLGVSGAIYSLVSKRSGGEKAPAPQAATAAPFNPKPQPPGPVPAGKVWSREHGHWHDVAPSSSGSPAASSSPIQIQPPAPVSAGTPAPPPPGPAPAGKVWSTEHGHWHDVPGAAASTTTVAPQPVVATTTTPQPPGPAPAGKVWSPEHGHWHDVPKQ